MFCMAKKYLEGGSSSRVVLGAAKWREKINEIPKIPGSTPGPDKLLKKIIELQNSY